MQGSQEVRELVRREVSAHLGATPLSSGELVEPGEQYFADPKQQRFVTVELGLVPATPRGGWEPRLTTFAGFHELRVVVDRRHMRVATLSAHLREDLERVLATRGAALERARQQLCVRPVSVYPTRVMPSGLADYWRVEVDCGAQQYALVIEDDGRLRPELPGWLVACGEALKGARDMLAKRDPAVARATLSQRGPEMVNAASAPVGSLRLHLGDAWEVHVTQPLDMIPAGASQGAWEHLPRHDESREGWRLTTARAMAWIWVQPTDAGSTDALAAELQRALDECLR